MTNTPETLGDVVERLVDEGQATVADDGAVKIVSTDLADVLAVLTQLGAATRSEEPEPEGCACGCSMDEAICRTMNETLAKLAQLGAAGQEEEPESAVPGKQDQTHGERG
jgi:hypothetical protein